MTWEELRDRTYPLPLRPGDREQYLRSLVQYPSTVVTWREDGSFGVGPVPPQVAFDGPWGEDQLAREIRTWGRMWRSQVQLLVDEGLLSGPEVELREVQSLIFLDALEKAVPLAEEGWKIYCFDLFLAVLVRQPGKF